MKASNGILENGVGYNSYNGGSLIFDGLNDRFATNYGVALNDYTVCVYYKDGGSGSYGRLVDKGYTNAFWLGKNDVVANSWGGGIKQVSSPYGIFLTLTDGYWHFLVSTRLGAINTLYGDGINNTTSGTVTATTLDTTKIAIGCWSTQSSQLFKGNISVVLIYNRALTPSEIQNNYNTLKVRYGL